MEFKEFVLPVLIPTSRLLADVRLLDESVEAVEDEADDPASKSCLICESISDEC